MTIRTEQMQRNLELTHGALFSQRALTALVDSGMTRDDAYRLVQESAQRAWDEGIEFRELIGASAPQLDLDQRLRLRRLPHARPPGDGAARRAQLGGRRVPRRRCRRLPGGWGCEMLEA